MAVDLYKSVDRSKVDSLPFLVGSHAFGYINVSDEQRLGVVYEIGADDCKKIRSLFKGKEERQIKAGDKVFVLPGCRIPHFKIREFCRGVGASMVIDIENATVFVGNERVYYEGGLYNYDRLDSLGMIMYLTYIECTNSDSNQIPTGIITDEAFKDYYPQGVTQARFTKSMASKKNNFYGGSVRQMYCITPYTARVAYEILSRQVPTINEKCLLKQLPTAAILDSALCDQVTNMLRSPDDATRKVAHEILANCDYTDAHLYLYKLGRHFYHDISRSRYKNVRLFVKESNLMFYYTTGEEKFLKFLRKKNKLDKEALEYLMPGIAQRLINNLTNIKSSTFNVKIELREELSDLLGDHDYNKEMPIVSLTTETDE